jgi:hypothetical protein
MLGEESETSTSQNLPPNKFFNPGSTISLKCIIRRHLIKNATINEITNVTWKKNKVPIELQMQERIRKVKKLQQSSWLNDDVCSMGVSVSGHLVTSTLLISNAVMQDAGPYSCTLPVFRNKDFPRAKAYVHVIYGKTFYKQFYSISKMFGSYIHYQ